MGFSSLEWQLAPVGSPLAFILSIECRETTSKSYILSKNNGHNLNFLPHLLCFPRQTHPNTQRQSHRFSVSVEPFFKLDLVERRVFSQSEKLFQFILWYSLSLSTGKTLDFFGLSIKAKVQLFTHTHTHTNCGQFNYGVL